MAFQDKPIRQKLMTMILLTSGMVLVLTCVGFATYQLIAARRATLQRISTIGKITANDSTAALAFDDESTARETLAALKEEPHIVQAALYDNTGGIFTRYPSDLDTNAFPRAPGKDGFRFETSYLVGFQPVVQNGRRLGTLYLESDLGAIYERFKLDGVIAVLVMAFSFLAAYLLSRSLQQQISRPILALAETARVVSERRDYSVRVAKFHQDELGLLTDAFNNMLGQIQEQNRALVESEARVRAVINSAVSAVVVMDAEGKIADWNMRAETMFGWSKQEAMGRSLAETIIPARYREGHKKGMERYLATGVGPILGRVIELNGLRRDGGEFPAELSISPMKTGEATAFCGFITDITERKGAEQKLQAQLARLDLLSRTTRAIGERQDLPSILQVVVRSLEDHLPVDFCCVGLYDAASETLTISGVGVKSQMLAMELAMTDQARIPIDENGLTRCIHGHLVYEPDITSAKFPFPKRLARGGLGSLVISPLLVESSVFGVLVAARLDKDAFTSADCEFLRQLSEHVALAAHQAQLYTALQRAYEDLRQTQQAVMQQERLSALGQMASGIAHDINNAISPVALYTESLLEHEPNLSPRARDYLQTIERAIDDVAATVARMREFYRQRETQLAVGPVDLNQMVEQVVSLTRARWSDMPQQRGVMIESATDLAKDLPAITGVESEIREALTNLIFNAVDAMPEGGKLTIRTGVVEGTPDAAGEPTARRVKVEVTDTGGGMDEDTRRRCLEPFFTTKGERGTGLGLAMVYGMVQRHSAEIEIDSALKKGTTVRLIFAMAETGVAGVASPGVARAALPRLRILIVDDDPMLLKSLRDTLEMDGHVVTVANGGQAGIDIFRASCESAEQFNVVITDLGMPRVDGRQVAGTVKGLSPAMPVILLTGWGQRLLAEGDVPPNVDQVLGKPPKLHRLREALANCCQSASG